MFGLTQIILALSPLTVAKAASEASDKRQMERQGYLDRDSLETLEARLVEAEKMLDIFEGKANQTAKWSKISRSISARITELTQRLSDTSSTRSLLPKRDRIWGARLSRGLPGSKVAPLQYSQVTVVIWAARLMASPPPRRRPFISWRKDGDCPWCH